MFDAIGHETVQRYPAVIRHWAANHPTKGISFHRSSNANPMHRFIPTLFAAMIVPHAQGQLQNMDFEVWDDPVVEGEQNHPTGWYHMSYIDDPSTIPFYNPPSTSAYSGSYALTLSVWYNYIKDRAYQAAAIQSRPVALHGAYTYVQNVLNTSDGPVADMALITIVLTKWNTVTSAPDTIGQGLLDIGGSAAYSTFDLPIVYTSGVTPDTVKLTLDCSILRRTPDSPMSTTSPPTCSFFTVDALALEEAVGITEEAADQRRTVYPDPTADLLHLWAPMM